jgi:hypothetical protein
MIDSTTSNPFCSRFLQPGSIPFCFRGTESISQLADRIRAPRGKRATRGIKAQTALRLSIVGPHGSGKSTLLHTKSSEEIAKATARVTQGLLSCIPRRTSLPHSGRSLGESIATNGA